MTDGGEDATADVATDGDDGQPPSPDETWIRRIPAAGVCGRYGTAAAPTQDGGVAFAGSADDTIDCAGSSNAWIGKLSADGEVLWSFVLGDGGEPGHEWVTDVKVLPDGRIVVLAWTSRFPPAGTASDLSILLVVVSDGGEIERQLLLSTPGIERANSMDVTSGGGLILTGGTDSSETSPWVLFALELAPDLSIAWQRFFDGPTLDPWDNEDGRVAASGDGGSFLLWTSSVMMGGFPVAVMRLGPTGEVIWLREAGIGLADTEYGFLDMAISAASDGGAIAALPADAGIQLIGLTSDGDLAWSRLLHGGQASSVSLLPDGGFLIAGSDETGDHRGWVAALDSGGNPIWQVCVADPVEPLAGRSAFPTPDGGIMAVSRGFDVTWFAKLTGTGGFYGECDHLVEPPHMAAPVDVEVVPGPVGASDPGFEIVDVDIPVSPYPASTTLECSGARP